MMKSISLDNCNCIDEVVELINGNNLANFSKEDLAAQYAWNGALEAGYGLKAENFEVQLDALIENGANFDYPAALELAINWAIQSDDEG